MRKIFTVFAFAAVLLGMASCKNDGNNDDVNLKRFKVTVDNITATSAHFAITPPDEQMPYVYTAFNNTTFNWIKEHPDGLKGALGIFSSVQGSTDGTWTVYPNTKYVLCVGEMDTVNPHTILGEVEYVRFQTPVMEPKLSNFVENEQQPLLLTGVCHWNDSINKNIASIKGEYLVPGPDEDVIRLFLLFGSDKPTGHFTTDDLFAYFIATSYVEMEDRKGKTKEAHPICGMDLTGVYNSQTGVYAYSGSCDYMAGEQELFRIPVLFQCTADNEDQE